MPVVHLNPSNFALKKLKSLAVVPKSISCLWTGTGLRRTVLGRSVDSCGVLVQTVHYKPPGRYASRGLEGGLWSCIHLLRRRRHAVELLLIA